MKKKISVVIPVFCNEQSLDSLFERLVRVEKELKNKFQFQLEIILIDDGSYDGSWELLVAFKKNRTSGKIIKLTRNFGGVHAVKIGFQYVTGEAFTMLAADLQDPPELILKMVEQWIAGNKFVICERENRHDPFLKILLSSIFYKIIRLMVLKNYPKGGFDLALMDKSLLPFLQKASKSSFPPILAYWLGHEPFVIKYTRQKRLHGYSKWSFKKRVNTFFDIIFGFSINPIRFISIFGSLISVASFFYGIFIFYNAIVGNITQPGFSSIITVLTFLLGLIILMLGIIGEYLWRILDEVNGRPEAVIDQIL